MDVFSVLFALIFVKLWTVSNPQRLIGLFSLLNSAVARSLFSLDQTLTLFYRLLLEAWCIGAVYYNTIYTTIWTIIFFPGNSIPCEGVHCFFLLFLVFTVTAGLISFNQLFSRRLDRIACTFMLWSFNSLWTLAAD